MVVFATWMVRLLLSGIGLGWVAVLLRTLRARKEKRFTIDLQPPPPPSGSAETVSVVIPARDEEQNIHACLQAALAQRHEALQVVVLDDASSDATAQIIRGFLHDPRVTLLQGDGDPPPGWLGKPWALARAQRAATGRWLLFLDADVVLHPQAVGRCLAYAAEHELHMLTGYGRLEARGFWENTLQPVVGGLILSDNPLELVNDPDHPDKVMANGQFILVRREAYDRMGGHEAVAHDVLDDVGLARLAKSLRIPFHCVFMRDLFSCRMYDGLSQIWQGWRKNLFAGTGYSWGRVLAACSSVFVFGLLSYLLALAAAVGLLGHEWLLWGVGLVAITQLVRLALDLLYQQPLRYGLTQPLGMALFIFLMLDSAWSSGHGQVAWKGRALTRRGNSPPSG